MTNDDATEDYEEENPEKIEQDGESPEITEDKGEEKDKGKRTSKIWTSEEERVVIESWGKGESWKEIAERLPNRSELAVGMKFAKILQQVLIPVQKETSASGSRKPPKDPKFDPKMSISGTEDPNSGPERVLRGTLIDLLGGEFGFKSSTDKAEGNGPEADEGCCPVCEKQLGVRCYFCGIPE